MTQNNIGGHKINQNWVKVDKILQRRVMSSQIGSSDTKSGQNSQKEAKAVNNGQGSINVKEAVKIALVTPLHLRSLIRKGKIDGKKDENGRWRINRQSVEEFTTKRREAEQKRLERLRNGQSNINVRPTTASAKRMRKMVEKDTKLSKAHKSAFLAAITRYETEWNANYEQRRLKQSQKQ